MKRTLRRLISRLLNRLVRMPRLKLAAQRILSRYPRLRGLVLRMMHGGRWFAREGGAPNAFDARGEQQQRLIEDLQARWNRPDS